MAVGARHAARFARGELLDIESQRKSWTRNKSSRSARVACTCCSRSRLLFTNLVLGIVSRVAQQMNIFSIGFPITLGVGMLGVLLTLPLLQTPFTLALERMLAQFQ